MAGWRSLRDHPDSRYLVLTAPRVLVRSPWGPDSVDEMHFVEEVEGPDASRYLWGNAAWRVADVTMKSFARFGWPCAIRGTEGGGKVENLPLHVFPSLSGARITQCPTEINITDRREKELSDQGIVALCHAKHTDYAVFFSGSTVHRPKKYVEDDATANARLSASLPYVLACARFAHYLMAIKRDRIGAFSSRIEDEQMLNTWISQYVTADDSASHGAKARYPLREARVTVEDVPGKPGVRRAVAHLASPLPARGAERVAAAGGGAAGPRVGGRWGHGGTRGGRGAGAMHPTGSMRGPLGPPLARAPDRIPNWGRLSAG